MSIAGADDIEAACGERYRREASDIGLGFKYRDMKEKLDYLFISCYGITSVFKPFCYCCISNTFS